jgi:hypothetical protein
MPQHPLQISHLLFKKQGSSQVLAALIPQFDRQIAVVDRPITANHAENDAYDLKTQQNRVDD